MSSRSLIYVFADSDRRLSKDWVCICEWYPLFAKNGEMPVEDEEVLLNANLAKGNS